MEKGVNMKTFDKDNRRKWRTLCLISLAVVTTASCTKPPQAGKPQSTDVEVVKVQQKDVPIYSQWIGTLDGFVNADVKAQVTGFLLKQEYNEGSFVKEGQLLFQIDPRPFRQR